MIDTREELIAALHEASEIEHGLLVQYLFAALSLKKRLDEGLTAPQQALVRDWEGALLRVAVDEMGHLGTVCNLLTAIGGAPRLSRPNFPLDVGYYPFSFELVPFSDRALYRLQVFELPRGFPQPPPPVETEAPLMDKMMLAANVVPDPLVYGYVGELYEKIQRGFETLDERVLFIGPPDAQSEDDWSADLDLRPVTDRATALLAIEDIIHDGEGSPAGDANSHYARFTRIREAYARAGHFQAARAIVVNPQTRAHRESSGVGTLVTHPQARAVSELFNAVYGVMLLLLQQYFSFGGESAQQREVVRSAAARMMSVAIRPLNEVLTELPATEDPADPRRAGPGFELYDDVSLPSHLPARWTLVLERLQSIVEEARRLGQEIPRIGTVGETLGFIRRSLAIAAKGG